MEQDTSENLLNSNRQALYTPTGDERTMAILSHVLALPFPLLAPLVIYLIKKDESKYVAEHARESLNFQITAMLVMTALGISIVGIILIIPVLVIVFVLVIVATIKASDDRIYRYPLSIRLIK